jgi:iron complex transport system ATP-binding protein
MGDSETLLRVHKLRFGPPGAVSHDELSFELKAGQCVLVLGPNGVGKTSLLRSLLGFLPIHSGQIFWRDQGLSCVSAAQLSRTAALVAQSLSETPDFTVSHFVLLGRLARLGPYAAPGHSDHQCVAAVLERLGIERLSDQPLDRLSGGEQQLARLARALAQQAQVLLLDEPAANLDPGNQVRLLKLLAQLRREGFALIMSTHDPWHAAGLADQVLLGLPQRRWLLGPAARMLGPDSLSRAYGVEFEQAVTASGTRVPLPSWSVESPRHPANSRRL